MRESFGVISRTYADGKVEVIIETGPGCGSCDAGAGGCHCGSERPDITIKADNPVGASVGDRVSIGHPPRAVLKSLTVFFIIPAAGLILGILSRGIFEAYGISSGFTSAAGLAAGIGAGILLYLRIRGDLQPMIGRVVSRADREADPVTSWLDSPPSPGPG